MGLLGGNNWNMIYWSCPQAAAHAHRWHITQPTCSKWRRVPGASAWGRAVPATCRYASKNKPPLALNLWVWGWFVLELPDPGGEWAEDPVLTSSPVRMVTEPTVIRVWPWRKRWHDPGEAEMRLVLRVGGLYGYGMKGRWKRRLQCRNAEGCQQSCLAT